MISDEPFSATEKHIAKRLQVRRKLMGISIERMTFVMSLTPDQYCRIEEAQRRIPQSKLEEFAFLLNVPTRYFDLEV